MKKAKIILAVLGIMMLNVGMFVLPAVATSEACGEHAAEFPDICQQEKHEYDMIATVGSVLNVVFGLIGIIAVIFVVIGGFKYSTSQGDPGKVSQAKNTIMYAIIGLLVTIFAFAITQFAMNAFTGQG